MSSLTNRIRKDVVEVTHKMTNFELSDTIGCSPFDINLTNTSTGNSLIYTWDFGDGAISDVSKVNYSYGSAGEYELTLTVTDEAGLSHTAQQTTQVTQIPEGTPPTVVIDGPSTALVGETVTFRADNSQVGSNPISKFNWQSGVGTHSDATINAVFTTSYEQPGTYYPWSGKKEALPPVPCKNYTPPQSIQVAKQKTLSAYRKYK